MGKPLTPRQVAVRLRNFIDKVESDGPLWSTIAKMAATERSRQIYKKKDYDGTAFKPLKDTTIASKKKKGYPHPLKPLIATGMLASIAYDWKPGQASIVIDGKAEWHETEGPHNRPARKTMGLSEEAKDRIAKFFDRRFKRILQMVMGA